MYIVVKGHLWIWKSRDSVLTDAFDSIGASWRVVAPGILASLRLGVLKILLCDTLHMFLNSRVEGIELWIRHVVLCVALVEKERGMSVQSRRKWKYQVRQEAYSLYSTEQTSPIVTPESLLMMVHQGDWRDMMISWLTRGSVAGSSLPTMLSPAGLRPDGVGNPVCHEQSDQSLSMITRWKKGLLTRNKMELEVMVL